MADKADGTRRPSAAKPHSIEKRREARRDFARPEISREAAWFQAKEDRRDFAAAIAKAEFGRFYWSGDQERALRAAVAKRAKPTR